MARTGRPRKSFDAKQWQAVDRMCEIHCTGEEIASVMGVDYDTLNKNCKEDKGMYISEYIKLRMQEGNTSLRRSQWKSAESGNVTMQIWLGKQWLGQCDRQEVAVAMTADESIKEMEAFFDNKKSSDGTPLE